jgi:acyl-CoA dehydrogenase
VDFVADPTTLALAQKLEVFLENHVIPAEARYEREVAEDDRWAIPAVMEELKNAARAQDLWNLFLPDPRYGAGLTNLQYAPLAELTGRSPILAPEAINCSAPDTGNMELLALFGSEDQRQEWLERLLDGSIRSAFCMTEPDVASSDATNIATSMRRDGEHYVVSGRKWWISGAMSPSCELLIVLGVTDPEGGRHHSHSMLLVPRDAVGVQVLESSGVYGYEDRGHGGHAEVVFDEVRVPLANLLGDEGGGFAMAQARLGPGRIHHAMRAIGLAERALGLLIDRAASRSAFGSKIADKGVIQQWIADARIQIEQTRLLVLKTAWLMDTVGNREAQIEISAIKVASAELAWQVLDRAIQVHGAAGVSQAFPLAQFAAHARILRIADGPDEVHRMAIARREIRARRATTAARL